MSDLSIYAYDGTNTGPISLMQSIEMQVSIGGASGAANTYIETPEVATKLNTADFDGTVTFYFECCLRNHSTGTAFVQLYNHTDGVAVAGSELVQVGQSANDLAQRQRSGAITLSGDKVYTVQLKHSTNIVNTTISGTRLIVLQTGAVTKTQIHQQLGVATSGISSTSNTNVPANMSRFLYEASKYDGTIAVRHDATLQAPLSNTVTSGIYDETAAAVVTGSEVSTASSTPVIQSSSTVALVDGHIYRPTLYVSGGSVQVNTTTNKLVFSITGGLTKYMAYISVFSAQNNGNSNTSRIGNINVYPNFVVWADAYINFDTTQYTGTLTTYYESNLSISDASQTAYSNLQAYDYFGVNASAIPGTEVNNTGNTNIVRVRSSSFVLPSGSTDLATGISSSNSVAVAKEYTNYLILQVSLYDVEPPSRRLVVSDEDPNVFDNPTVGEHLFTPQVEYHINKNDGVTTNEFVQYRTDRNINVSDTVTTSEFRNISALQVSDTVSTTESIGIFIPTLSIITHDGPEIIEEFFNVVETLATDVVTQYDIISTKETIILLITELFITVFDMSPTGEFMQPSLGEILINRVDNVSTQEYIQFSQPGTINVSDAANTREFIDVLRNNTRDITVADSLVTSENILAAPDTVFINQSDMTTISEHIKLTGVTLPKVILYHEFISLPVTHTVFLTLRMD